MSSDDDILESARAGFLDEATDMLRQFEQALLAMEQDPADAEAINSAFRAAHTIKGGAGLFGYDAVVGFTHEVESALEAMRSGQLALNDAGMALLLQGRDQMEALLAEVARGDSDPATARRSEELGEALRALRGSGGGAPAVAQKASAPSAATPVGTWHVSLRVGPDALRNGLDPLPFIRYLDTLGTVSGIRTLTDDVPTLDALDPEGCCLGFEIRLQTDRTREAIVEVFDFLAEDCTLRLLPPDAGPDAYEALLGELAPAPPRRAALLVHWQALAGPDQPPFIERRQAAPTEDRRQNEPERRSGPKERRGGDDARFVRVRADKLDRLIDLIGELVIAGSGAQLVAREEQSPRFAEAAQRIHDLVQEARDGALGLRMVPVGETFTRFHRVVRDVSKQLGKNVELQITGGDTELDKSMVETIADPLMHLVRNSLDHGLENPDDRAAAGKGATGRLALNAYHESGSVVIEVSDDGRGLNPDKLRRKAIERGLIPADAEVPDHEAFQLIFLPGFSTAEQVTDLSGRGVGMDVVRRNIEALRGHISLASQPGRGTTTQIRLPLTLAMIDGFLTQVGGTSYVLPLAVVAECIDVPAECTTQPDRVCGCFDLRGEVLPYLDLSRFYGAPAAAAGSRRALVVVREGHHRIGLVVDRLLGEHQTVIKPLSPIFRHLKAISGSTILGSGDVALVLDVPGLMACATQLPPALAAVAATRHAGH